MSNWRDQKRAGRRDIHREMGVPALLMLARTSQPFAVTVRGPHTKRPVRVGDLGGGGDGWAEREEIAPRIIFDRLTLPVSLVKGAIVSIEPGEAYRVAQVLPVDDEFVAAEVVALSAADASGLPLPGAGC